MGITKLSEKAGGVISPFGAFGNSGVWTLKEAYGFIKQNTWPLLDPYWQYVSLLLSTKRISGGQNNTFLDSSTNNFTITRNGNTTQGTFSPFSLPNGEWSNFFDGTDDYLSVADNAVLRPGAGAFTLEAWIYRNASGAAHTVYAKGGASTGIVLQVTSGNVLRFTHTTTNIDSTGTVAANAWVHVAVVREGTGTNQTKLYINGTQDGQGTVTTDFTQTEEVRIGTNRSAGDDFAGYISNVRFVKGSALYTGNFTPSTSPFTTTSQGALSSEVELLTCQSNRFKDNSSNAFAITRNGDVRVTAFSPFIPNEAYSPSVNGGSGYFDGTGDKLTIAANSAFQFGTGDFAIEFWYYPTSLSNYQTPIDMGYNNSGSHVIQTGNGDGIPLFYSAGSGLLTSSTAWTANAFNHVVVCRSGTTLSMFINGSRTATATNSTNLNSNSTLGIGAAATQSPDLPVVGYMSNVRLVKGSAVYDPTQTTITIPTSPLTAITNTSLLCNFTNANIFDSTGKNNLETVGNAQISTAQSKFGGASAAFDGTGDYLSVAASATFDVGAGDYTIEFWVYWNAIANIAMLFGWNGGVTGSTFAYTYSDGRIGIGINGSNEMASSASQATTGAWIHLAFVKQGSTTTIYKNGSSIASGTTSVWYANTGTDAFYIAGSDSIGDTNCYIDDLRITKGVARYTSNFTPPQREFRP